MSKFAKSLKTIARFNAATRGLTSMEFALYASVSTLALALIVAPWLEDVSAPKAGIDQTVTGSVEAIELPQKRIRSISRSVLQQPNDPPCIVYTDNSDNGFC